jgi:hypothetical protein
VKVANFHLGKVREQLGGGEAILADQVGETTKEDVVREMRQREVAHGRPSRGGV